MSPKRYSSYPFAAAATLAVVAVAALPPAGCGGGEGKPTTANTTGRTYGTLQLQIAWPKSDTRVIPPRTRELRVTVTSLEGFFDDNKKQRTLPFVRPEGPSAPSGPHEFPGIPPGNVSVDVTAHDAAGNRVGRTTTRLILIQPGVKTSFSAELISDPVAIPNVASFDIVETKIIAGEQTAKATVKLSSIAPEGGSQVTLSSNLAVGLSPTTVTVPFEKTEVTFDISTNSLDAAPANPVEITATYNNSSKSDTLTLGVIEIETFRVLPSSVVGGTSTTGEIKLRERPPFEVTFNLSSLSPAFASTPGSAKIGPDSQSVTFGISTGVVKIANDPISRNVTLRAERGTYRKETDLTVRSQPLPDPHPPADRNSCSNCHSNRSVGIPQGFNFAEAVTRWDGSGKGTGRGK